jgi:hypothetical protein
MVPETSIIIKKLMQLIAQEDFLTPRQYTYSQYLTDEVNFETALKYTYFNILYTKATLIYICLLALTEDARPQGNH